MCCCMSCWKRVDLQEVETVQESNPAEVREMAEVGQGSKVNQNEYVWHCECGFETLTVKGRVIGGIMTRVVVERFLQAVNSFKAPGGMVMAEQQARA